MLSRLLLLTTALCWGSLSAVGFYVVPMLFAHLPTPALAGGVAARLFAAQCAITVLWGAVMLLALNPKGRLYSGLRHEFKGNAAIVLVVSAMLAALLLAFAVAPRIVARDNLRLWHTVGTALYVWMWLGSGMVLWRLAGSARAG